MQSLLSRTVLTSSACLALGLSGSSFAQGNVLVVDAAGGPFTDIQPAIDAAADGDTILVRPGAYATFQIQAKGLRVIGDPAFQAGGGIVVRDLAPGQSVVLHGVGTTAAPSGIGLALVDNQGPVWVQNSALLGQSIAIGDANGHAGARVTNSERVSFLRSFLRGGVGGPHGGATPVGGNGGAALLVDEGTVLVQSCDLLGGAGTNTMAGATLSNGGAGAQTLGGTLVLTSSEVTGGPGGTTSLVLGGNGGPGVRSDGGLAIVVAMQATGGQAGSGLAGEGYLALAGTIQLHGAFGSFSLLNTSSPVREGQPLALQYQAPPNGQQVFAAVSTSQNPVFLPSLLISVYLAAPVSLVPLGPSDFEGFLATALVAPTLPAGLDQMTVYLQAFSTVDLGGGVLSVAVSGGAAVTILDSSF
jgi:hypothetical protein